MVCRNIWNNWNMVSTLDSEITETGKNESQAEPQTSWRPKEKRDLVSKSGFCRYQDPSKSFFQYDMVCTILNQIPTQSPMLVL